MLFDAHGTPLKTLSRTEKTNLSPDSSFLLDKWDSWSATFQEARDLKNSISYMARVRNSEGEEWVADTNAIMQEVQLLKLKLESSN